VRRFRSDAHPIARPPSGGLFRLRAPPRQPPSQARGGPDAATVIRDFMAALADLDARPGETRATDPRRPGGDA
jgi:hypothetical protein